MYQKNSQQQADGCLIPGIATGFFSGVVAFFTLSAVGLPQMETVVIAVLSALTIGAFICRERSLANSLKHLSHRYSNEIELLENRIRDYYDNSLACLAYFDAGTLWVGKVSPGFLHALRIPADLTVSAKPLPELLRVAPSSIEAVVTKAQRGAHSGFVHCLTVEDWRGFPLEIEMTAVYCQQTHMVEASFIVSQVQAEEEGDNPLAPGAKDLERFRRGMYRRETRILELKEEVNNALKAAGEAPRYQIDQSTKEHESNSKDFLKSRRHVD